MKNITVTVSDETYHYARVWAARNDTTVSALVRQFLKSMDEHSFPDYDLPDYSPDDEAIPPSPLFPVEL